MRLLAKGVLAITSALLLYQIEVGWYGIWLNWLLLGVLVLVSFNLGYWDIQ